MNDKKCLNRFWNGYIILFCLKNIFVYFHAVNTDNDFYDFNALTFTIVWKFTHYAVSISGNDTIGTKKKFYVA